MDRLVTRRVVARSLPDLRAGDRHGQRCGWRPTKLAALRALAANQKAAAIAELICDNRQKVIRGADVTVQYRVGCEPTRVVAGVSLDQAELDSLALVALPASQDHLVARGAHPGRWHWLSRIAGDDHLILSVTKRGGLALRSHEHRVAETCMHFIKVAFSQDLLCERLETANERLELAIGSISQGVCLFDGSGRLVLANRRYGDVYDIAPGLIRPGLTLADVFRLREEAGSIPAMTAEQYVDWRNRLNVGEAFSRSVAQLSNGRTVEISNQPTADGGWVATHEDITARVHAEAKMSHMAQHDALTGLANRNLLRERLESLLDAPDRLLHAVLCLDLDGFKPVNDSFGHPAGDALLRAVASRLRRCTRDTDIVGRLGGDEFAILAIGLDQPGRETLLAQRLIKALSRPFRLAGATITIGVSVGVVLCGVDGDTADELLRKADLALYRAKVARGTYRIFEPTMEDVANGRLRLEKEIRDGIVRGEFEPYYQPLHDVRTGGMRAVEALIRWRHPTRGLLKPTEFVPAAEASCLITALDTLMLRQACRDARRWPEHITVSVNLSAAQFKRSALVELVRDALDHSGLPPCRLELELTETMLLENTGATLSTLEALRAMGVRIALDDFGTGHSSFSYLLRFPFNKLKIDQSYVREMAQRSESLAIVRAILELGRSLRMVTTAEGVETEAQLAQLRVEGCDEVQGFLFSAPRPAADITAMFAAGLNADRSAVPAVVA